MLLPEYIIIRYLLRQVSLCGKKKITLLSGSKNKLITLYVTLLFL